MDSAPRSSANASANAPGDDAVSPPSGDGSSDVDRRGTDAPRPRAADQDLTARARIRDAAVACFAERGVAGASVRAIADDAGVSPALVIHHFGSKDALRVACDEHVAAIIRQGKQEALTAGAGLDPVASLRAVTDGPPYLRYLARTLVDGSPHVAELIDEMVEDAVGYLDAGVAAGTLKPTDDQRGRAVVLMMWSLGALVLHEHVTRLTGADLVDDPANAESWMLPALELLTDGVLDEAVRERYREVFAEREEEGR